MDPAPNPGGGDDGGDDGDGGDGGDGGQTPDAPTDGAEPRDFANFECPTGTLEVTVGGTPQCQISGTITENLTLTASQTDGTRTIYTLNGAVFIGEDLGPDPDNANPDGQRAVLTIEPGTTVYGQDTDSILVVSRGSELRALGTENAPIVFTSAEDVDTQFPDANIAGSFGRSQRSFPAGSATRDPHSGEWGGLIVNGRAPINVGLETQGEGDSGLYGGTDAADSSGVLNYVQVRYAGFEITPENELNGIAFQGVGSGTSVDRVQVHNNDDDGVEFFGGTVNAKRVVVTGADDDSIDWTQGWQGNLQFAVVVQNPEQLASDSGIEADNNSDNFDITPRSNPTIANAVFVGASGTPDGGDAVANDVGGEGWHLRRGTGLTIANAVVTGFDNGQSLEISDDATFPNLTFQSIALDSAVDFESQETEDAFLAGTNTVFSNRFDGSQSADPYVNSLRGPLPFISGAREAAIPAADTTALGSFFDAAPFVGGVSDTGPSADGVTGNWTLNWTFKLNPAPECPVENAAVSDVDGQCTITGTITDNLRLQAGIDYYLDGGVFVGEDAGGDPANPNPDADTATLTIEPGVTMIGVNEQSRLVVSRGSQIFANGTATAPITMIGLKANGEPIDVNSVDDLATVSGRWGGLIVNGRAQINVGLETQGEGDSGFYGGVDDSDSSGSISYLRLIGAGFEITPENELNGIALQGVGSGTTIDSVQVHNNDDDGIEFFGGAVNAKRLVMTGSDDDSVDWTQGWRGDLQFVVVVQNPRQLASDSGIEADNNSDNFDATPRANARIANGVFVGASALDPNAVNNDVGGEGWHLRRGTGAEIVNSVVVGFDNAQSLEISDDATFANLSFTSVALDSAIDFESQESEDAFTAGTDTVFSQRFDGSQPTDPYVNTVRGRASGQVPFISGNTEVALTAADPTTLGSFFEAAPFVGAVTGADNDFTAGWTVFLDQQVQSILDAQAN
ncbi:hypothetical protein CCR85_09070 [Rhodothalassium salexigens]|uniref:hypothetical protein n=1 Tax=Rhodothalassium salexigens TaxID=1086 RepID=UPI0019116DFD|nr:hypothetical protein [Rhodothalassium salexigens]MBK5911636.1 hypothetical protein [Rhodothalassium salexigens]MBK5920929.1 hypothetical protein [Rhodothalassium salexigens]